MHAFRFDEVIKVGRLALARRVMWAGETFIRACMAGGNGRIEKQERKRGYRLSNLIGIFRPEGHRVPQKSGGLIVCLPRSERSPYSPPPPIPPRPNSRDPLAKTTAGVEKYPARRGTKTNHRSAKW